MCLKIKAHASSSMAANEDESLDLGLLMHILFQPEFGVKT